MFARAGSNPAGVESPFFWPRALFMLDIPCNGEVSSGLGQAVHASLAWLPLVVVADVGRRVCVVGSGIARCFLSTVARRVPLPRLVNLDGGHAA